MCVCAGGTASGFFTVEEEVCGVVALSVAGLVECQCWILKLAGRPGQLGFCVLFYYRNFFLSGHSYPTLQALWRQTTIPSPSEYLNIFPSECTCSFS